MNTVKIGDDFENRSYNIIEQIINSGNLGVFPEYCTIKQKARYPSHRRKKGIVFDLSIEVTLPNFNKPTLLYLIECKYYSSSIPIDDVVLFASYMNEIDNYAKKGIFITNTKLQSGAIEEIKSHGIMLIEVDYDNYNIIFPKKSKNFIIGKYNEIDDIIFNAISKILLPQEIQGLKKLSSTKISSITCELLNNFNPNIIDSACETPIFELLEYLKEKDNLKFQYSEFTTIDSNEILGFYNSEKNIILVNSKIKNTVREKFIIAHEIGHYILHKDLKINQNLYNNFKDPFYNFFQQKPLMNNPKNWIEWQANKFAASLILPEYSLHLMLIATQKMLGISKCGTIYLDEQECNKRDFRNILEYLAVHFGVSKINIEYRLYDLNLVHKKNSYNDQYPDFLKDIISF